jgi:hypothetical protein
MALATIFVLLLASVPYVVRFDRAAPAAAIAVWFGVLAMRLVAVLLLIVWIAVYLPATDAFTALTHWCFHTAIPRVATHLGVDGHAVGDIAKIAPFVAVSVSLVSVSYGLVRASRAVRQFVRRARIGDGPSESVVVREPRVLVAVAGVTRPHVIVSSGALQRLDACELAAGLEHERGHIGRRHQYVLLAAELCRALARFVPGTNRAMRELIFHVERDADDWAVRRNHDPAVLASAICKAALAPTTVAPALTGGEITRRVSLLLADKSRRRLQSGFAGTLAIAFAVISLGLATTIPSAFASLPVSSAAAVNSHPC